MVRSLGILIRRRADTLVLSGTCFRIHKELKTLPGWQYDPVLKTWTVPAAAETEVLAFAAAKGEPVTFAEDDATGAPEAATAAAPHARPYARHGGARARFA